MFQASYNSEGWVGDVKAYEVSPVTGEVNMESYAWSASDELEDLNWNNRKIVTYYDDGTTRNGVPFREDNLSNDQKTFLDNDWDISGITNIINFLRGDRKSTRLNGGVFRNRTQKLGDIVHSSPLHKNGILYTGGNDGMLHAFAGSDSGAVSGGQELFAYIPNLVFPNLINLADPNYGFESHAFFVDVTPSVADMWRTDISTILVGSLGRGGKGLYAIDISGLSNETFATEITDEGEG